MPITKAGLAKLLTDQGQDPSKFDLDTGVNLYNQAEASEQNKPQTPEQISGTEAFVNPAKRSLFPTLAGGSIGGLTMAALAPETGGLSLLPILAGTVVGAGTSFGANKLQEKILQRVQGPEEYQKGIERLELGSQQHPVLSTAGEIAPMLLQGRPSLKLNLARRALGGGIMGGIDVAQQGLLSDQPYDPLQTAKAVGLGATFDEPFLLGKTKAFGYKPEVSGAKSTVERPLTGQELFDYGENQQPAPNAAEVAKRAAAIRPDIDVPNTIGETFFDPNKPPAGQSRGLGILPPNIEEFNRRMAAKSAAEKAALESQGTLISLRLNPEARVANPLNPVIPETGIAQQNEPIRGAGKLIASPGNLPPPLIREQLTPLETVREKVGTQPANPNVQPPKREAVQIPILGAKIEQPLRTLAQIAAEKAGLANKPAEQQQPLSKLIVPIGAKQNTPLENQLIRQKKIVTPEEAGLNRATIIKGGQKLQLEPPDQLSEQGEPTTKLAIRQVKSLRENIDKAPEAECFNNARKYANKHDDGNTLVVHGKVKTLQGKIIDHAWVESGDYVIDPTAGVRTTKADYYSDVQAVAENKYTPTQANINMVRNRNHGPWTPEEIGGREVKFEKALPVIPPELPAGQRAGAAKQLISKEHFSALGSGHKQLVDYFDQLERSRTVDPVVSAAFRELVKDVPDDVLSKFHFVPDETLKNAPGVAKMFLKGSEDPNAILKNKLDAAVIRIKERLSEIGAKDPQLSDAFERFLQQPNNQSIVVLVHEFAHPLLYELGPERLKIVEDAFKASKAQGTAEQHFQAGLSETKGAVQYYAQDIHEFWAQSFSEYAMQKMLGKANPWVSFENLRNVLKFAWQRFSAGIAKLMTRDVGFVDEQGQYTKINDALRPVFESVLGGERADEFSAREQTNLAKSGQQFQPTEENLKELYSKNVASKQRGAPEHAMMEATMFHHGILSGLLEHVGDLTHRMSEKVTWDWGGYEYVKEKVDRALRYLTQKYGFLREHNENIEHNASNRNMSENEYRLKLEGLLNNYVEEHSKIPVYNEVQKLARDSAIDLGNENFAGAVDKLSKLKEYINQGEKVWTTKAHEYDPNIAGQNNISIEKSGEPFIPPATAEENQKQVSQKNLFSLPVIRSLVERVNRLGGTYSKVANGATNFYQQMSELYGHYFSDVGGNFMKKAYEDLNLFHPMDFATQNSDRNQRVVDSLFRDFDTQTRNDEGLSPKEIDLKNTFHNVMDQVRNDQIARGIPVEGRQAGRDPLYIPQRPRSVVLKALLENPGSKEAAQFKQDFLNDRITRLGMTEPEAQQEFNRYLEAYSSTGSESNIASQFGPIDKAEGEGLPDSWREKNLINLMHGYLSRVARRFAYYDAFESKPELLNALGIKRDVAGNAVPPTPGIEPVGGNPDVKLLMHDITTAKTSREITREAMSGVVRAGMMQTPTAINNLIQGFVQGFTYFTPKQAVAGLADTFVNFKSNWDRSFAMGINRQNIGQLEASMTAAEDVITFLHGLRNITNSLTLRNASEKLQRATAFGQAKFAAIDNINWLQNNGIAKGQRSRFMDAFFDGDWRARINNREGFTPIEIDRMAARYVDAVQGTYDYRQLPPIAVEGSLAPFLSISRWNIGQANMFVKNVLNPAFRGEFTPLLMSALGAGIGGSAVMAMRQLITGRKEHTPTIGEIKQAGAEGESMMLPAFYKASALADAAGFAGILGTFAHSLMDITAKNRPQEFTAPLLNAVTTTGGQMADLIQAAKDGDVELSLDTISHILEGYIQNYRMMLSTAARVAPEELGAQETAQQIDKANKLRDLRSYKYLHDIPYAPVTEDRANIFENQDIKQLKQSQDLGQIQSLLPAVLKRLFARYAGNPELLGRVLQGLKQNSYQTIPSIDKTPIMAGKYLDFVGATQGQNSRDALLQDYLRQTLMNRLKSGSIPSW